MDTYIVTITTMNSTNTIDMELSATVPLKQLVPKIVEALVPLGFSLNKNERIRLESEGRLLNGDETLEDAGAFDGSILQLI